MENEKMPNKIDEGKLLEQDLKNLVNAAGKTNTEMGAKRTIQGKMGLHTVEIIVSQPWKPSAGDSEEITIDYDLSS